MIINIDTSKIVALVEDGKKFMFEQASEDSIAELLELADRVNTAVAEVKAHIAKQGTELNPNFTGVRGDRVRVMYRYYGSAYLIDKLRIADMDDKYYAKSITYRPNTKEVEAFVKTEGKTPMGILVNTDRVKQVSMSYIATDPEELAEGVPDES